MDVLWFLATASILQTLPMTGKVFRSICLDKSGETVLHSLPRLVDLNTTLAAKYKVAGSCGLINNGASQFQR